VHAAHLLECREAAKDCHHQLAVRRRGIASRIVQRLELRALLGDLVQDIQQIAG
jgi:hypothetical protein